ncbi:flagellar export protein FliJ [Amphibacillus cookii]|uniref:flagellar export protein FliJ n=1 Tax=Amphibacillus cookii TaxID=767787 RepID=UPI001959F6BE|nr:flagellar export protein FliJ [Amphibacillus cookii]MBM7540572.1 flagellar FliJ protein [Amphibacillus cookii]
MTTVKAFHKILNHQERLKNQAYLDYQDAVSAFELIAEQLYQLLYKKEQVEKEYNYYLTSSGTVTTLATHYAFIEQIKQKIYEVEMEVNRKRSIMEQKQQKLTTAHVEVKKYEKIIENKQKRSELKVKYLENQTMDELSSRQHFNYGNR